MTRALEYVEQGRRAAEAKKQSSAIVGPDGVVAAASPHGDGRQAMRLIQHLQQHHLEEPGVGETLTRMLIQVGLLRPDGTPAFGPGGVPGGNGGRPSSRRPSRASFGLPIVPSRAAAAGSSGRQTSRPTRFCGIFWVPLLP